MSIGHRHHHHTLTSSELDDLLDEALADRRVKRELAKPFRVIIRKDVPLLGSSAVGWGTIYIDEHFRFRGRFAALPVGGRVLDVRPGLIRHESLEPILENIYGWPYGKLAHPVAQHWEERYYRAKGFDPVQVEESFAPYIAAMEREPLKCVPTDLDLRPMLDDKKLLERTRASQEAQKKSQANVRYVDPSPHQNKRCGLCSMFVKEAYGGPACTLVKSPIAASGVCRRFVFGSLDGQANTA